MSKQISSLGGLLLAGVLLSGCAAAVMTGAKTVKGSDSNIITIVPKTETISAVGKVTVDTSGLSQDTPEKQKDVAAKITNLLIENLKAVDLYQPGIKDSYEVSVTIRNMKRDINERAVYAIVNVLNSDQQAVYSFASAETSEGLRTIDHIEKTFCASAVEEIAKPLPPAQ